MDIVKALILYLVHESRQERALPPWAPSYLTSSRSLKVIVHTLQSVFSHLTAWTNGSVGDMIFLAGKGGPLEIDYQKFLERVRRPEVKQDLLRVGLQPELVPFELFVMDEEELGVYLYADLHEPLPTNTDNLLFTEFSSPKQLIRRNTIPRFVRPGRLHGDMDSLLGIVKNVDLERLGAALQEAAAVGEQTEGKDNPL